MKLLKRFIVLLLVVFSLTFVLASCDDKNAEQLEDAAKKVVLTQDKQEIRDDFEVPAIVKIQDTVYTITWTSNNPLVTIENLNDNFKKVIVNYEDNLEALSTVTLTATISNGKKSVEKTFTIKIPKFEQTGLLKDSVTSPEVGVEYMLGIPQTLKDDVYFFTGVMSGYYGATQTDHNLGVYVKLAEAIGGYYLTFEINGATKYINTAQNEKHLNFVIGDTASSVWTWNEEYSTLVSTCGEFPVFAGTNDNYVTFGLLNTEELGKTTVYPARLYSLTKDENQGGNQPSVDNSKPITIAQALEICAGLGSGQTTAERYTIKATIKSIDKPEYGTMTIVDATGTISVYGSYSSDGSLKYSEMSEKPYANYEVTLSCILKNFNGNYEINNARIIEFKELEATFNEADYTVSTIDNARKLQADSKVKVTGVVAKITYAFGMIPNGFYLVDNTNSIYVYDSQLAPRVKEGDKITICASRTNWILESEQNNAAKFEYTGCIQLAEAYLIGEIESNNNVDLSWVIETTVKEIMDTQASTNITTTIYKVNAYVNKVDGNGFVNYYINDIDDKTGSYCYTQCSGSDFSWLDEFDGKICTVYLSVINAKATQSACIWRLLPIKVVNENYTFDLNEAGSYAITYHVLNQFLPKYTGNPQLELISSVMNEKLGIKEVAITYSSNNEDVVFFENDNGKIVLNTKNVGTAEITITATYNSVPTTKTITITVAENIVNSAITVKNAIAATVGDEVTVKGIVGPSLVNKVGFYLMDEEGLIAIETTQAQMVGLEIGHYVVVKGIRHFNKKDADSTTGQVCINNAEIISNDFGKHELPNSYFKQTTCAAFNELDINEDHTTEVYVLKGKLTLIETDYYTSLKFIAEDGTEVALYMSGAAQYNSITSKLGNQTATFVVAPCNWNSKTDKYRGCILYATLEDGTVIYNTLNFDAN